MGSSFWNLDREDIFDYSKHIPRLKKDLGIPEYFNISLSDKIKDLYFNRTLVVDVFGVEALPPELTVEDAILWLYGG